MHVGTAAISKLLNMGGNILCFDMFQWVNPSTTSVYPSVCLYSSDCMKSTLLFQFCLHSIDNLRRSWGAQYPYTNNTMWTLFTTGEKVSAVMFCKQFLAYAVHIDWCYHSIHKHSSRSRHAPIWWHRGCIVVPSRVDI